MTIVSEIKEFVKETFYNPDSNYGSEPFVGHMIPMVRTSLLLADKLGADKEIVELAAWLHDIGSIVHGRKDHHITSMQIAQEQLEKRGYPQDKIDLIKKCIHNHRGSRNDPRESVEEKIIAEADAIVNFDNLEGLFKAAFVYENLNQQEARKSVREKLIRKWNQLELKESKDLTRPKYEAMLVLLGENDA